MRRAILGLILALSVPGAASAQSSAAPTPEARAEAQKLVDAMNFTPNLKKEVDASIAAMRSGASISQIVDSNPAVKMQRSKNPAAWDAALKKVGARQADVAQTNFADFVPLVTQHLVTSYANHFSIADLKALTAFYASPLGRRLTATLPQIGSEQGNWMQMEKANRMKKVLMAVQPDLQRELGPLLPKPPTAKKP